MLMGGTGTELDVDVIDLSNSSNLCQKPNDVPLKGNPVGIFFNGKALDCPGNHYRICYDYDSEHGKLHLWSVIISV